MDHEMLRRQPLGVFGLVASLFLVGCPEGEGLDATTSEDAGPDAGAPMDAAERRDAGMEPDAGMPDGGFSDPATIVEGIVRINGGRTYVHAKGTVTSTMPPLLMLPTGPHQGGVAGFFGSFGGGIGHEYLPEHMDFLQPGRLIIYYDYIASGRSGFGALGTATVTVDAHVLQVNDILDWAETDLGADTSQIDVFGHGYGAGVGALYAARNPDRVNRLVLVTPMGADVVQYANAIGQLQARLTSSDRQRLDIITREPECLGDGGMCTLEIWRILAPRLGCMGNEARVNTLVFAHAEIRTFNYLRQSLQNDQFDWRDELATITADTTVLSGPCDATPPEAALTYTSSISGAVHHEITGSGHWPMVESTTEFQRRVKDALIYP